MVDDRTRHFATERVSWQPMVQRIALRDLCRFGGVDLEWSDWELFVNRDTATIDAALAYTDLPEKSWDPSPMERLKNVLDLSISQRSVRAFRNALVIGEGIPEKLGDRREKFMAEVGISLRTLIRLEDQGAETLGRYLQGHALERLQQVTNLDVASAALTFLKEHPELHVIIQDWADGQKTESAEDLIAYLKELSQPQD